jgi:cyclopropane-fatty-acyl-phospholipid synthase
VIGGGICGVAAAYVLAETGVEVVVYEKEDNVGGHGNTVSVEGIDVGLDFMGFNNVSLLSCTTIFSLISSYLYPMAMTNIATGDGS